MEVKKNMTAIIKEKKRSVTTDEFDISIIDILDVSKFPIPAEMYISEKDIAW